MGQSLSISTFLRRFFVAVVFAVAISIVVWGGSALWGDRFLGLVNVFGFVFVLMQLWFVHQRLKIQSEERKAQALAQIFGDFVTPEFRKKLDFVYHRVPETLILGKMSKEEKWVVEDVTARFDGLGFQIRIGVIPRDESIELFWDLVILCAQQLVDHVVDQRRKRNHENLRARYQYKYDFFWLAIECKMFHLERARLPKKEYLEFRKERNKCNQANPALDCQESLLRALLATEPLEVFSETKPGMLRSIRRALCRV